MSRALREAQSQFKAGEKALKTGLFKWSPDYLVAVTCFENAAKGFARKDSDMRIKSLVKAAECCDKLENFSTAGGHLAAAAKEHLDQGKADSQKEAARLYEEAASQYYVSADQRNAASCLVDAANLKAGLGDLEGAAALIKQAVNYFPDSEAEHYGVPTFRAAMNFFMQHKQYNEADDILTLVAPLYAKLGQSSVVNRIPLYRVIIKLVQGDSVGADRAFTAALGMEGWAMMPEAEAAEELVKAMQEADDEALAKAKKLQVIKFLESPYMRAVRNMQVGAAASRPAVDPELQAELAGLNVSVVTAPAPAPAAAATAAAPAPAPATGGGAGGGAGAGVGASASAAASSSGASKGTAATRSAAGTATVDDALAGVADAVAGIDAAAAAVAEQEDAAPPVVMATPQEEAEAVGDDMDFLM